VSGRSLPIPSATIRPPRSKTDRPLLIGARLPSTRVRRRRWHAPVDSPTLAASGPTKGEADARDTAMHIRRNIEIKAKLADPGAARRAIQRIATERIGQRIQVDTYFHCRTGRLKLREASGATAELIWYDRPDENGPKPSRYYLVEVADPETLRSALSAALGVRSVVRKRREIYRYRFVRIHLDHVDLLGDFLELEGVLEDGVDEVEARRVVADLVARLQIPAAAMRAGSYGEMFDRATPE